MHSQGTCICAHHHVWLWPASAHAHMMLPVAPGACPGAPALSNNDIHCILTFNTVTGDCNQNTVAIDIIIIVPASHLQDLYL